MKHELMKRQFANTTFSVILMSVAFSIPSGVQAQGEVYPNPTKPYPGFKPHELSFHLTNNGIGRDEYRSTPFYAIILRTTEPCSVTEEERLKTQALLPNNKVFSTRFGCEDNIEENITYTNANPKFGFIAVYAGATLSQAKQFLTIIGATGQFPGANIRKMQVVLVYP